MVELADSFIDHQARRELAEALRHFVAGQTTNDQLESHYPPSKERGLQDVYMFGIWPLFDDHRTHKAIGKKKISTEAQHLAARVVLFLRSNQPYRYPIETGFLLPSSFLYVVTLGWYGRRNTTLAGSMGNEAFWPFFSHGDYQHALRNPIYLRGSSR